MVDENFFSNLPVDSSNEIFETIAEMKNVRIERIVSSGQATPEGQWYDQKQDEWVILLAGSAAIQIEGQELKNILPGDFMFIPSHCRHRVLWTDPSQKTLWLAVHIGEAFE